MFLARGYKCCFLQITACSLMAPEMICSALQTFIKTGTNQHHSQQRDGIPMNKRSFFSTKTHGHLALVLELQAKVVPLDQVQVGADQVKENLARNPLLQQRTKQNQGHHEAPRYRIMLRYLQRERYQRNKAERLTTMAGHVNMRSTLLKVLSSNRPANRLSIDSPLPLRNPTA